MTDINQQDFQKLLEAMKANTAAVLKANSGDGGGRPRAPSTAPAEKQYNTALGGMSKATIEASKSVSSSLMGLVDRHTNLGKSMDQLKGVTQGLDKESGALAKSFVTAARTAAAFSVAIISALPETIDSYRKMIETGQDFNGSMLQMNMAAAGARMSLDDFTKLVEKNSKVVATIGVKTFGAMSTSLRDSMDSVGMLGLTTDGLNEYLANYMETQRLYGQLEKTSSNQAVDTTKNFIDNVTKFSALTGTTRAEILKATTAALQDMSLAGMQSQMSGEASARLTASLGKAAAYLASMPAMGSDSMAKMLTQAIGRESAARSDLAKTFYSVGLGGIVDTVDAMAKKVKNGTASDEELDNYRKRMVKIGEQNMSSLRAQTLSNDATTRQNAENAIRMINEMKNLSSKTLKERAAQEAITNSLLRISEMWSKVTSFLKQNFLVGLEGVLVELEKSFKSPAFEKLKGQIVEYGTAFGKWLENLAKSDVWGTVGKTLSVSVQIMATLGSVIGTVVGGFLKLSDMIGGMGAAIVAFTGFIVAKRALSAFKEAGMNKIGLGSDPFRKYAVGNALRVVGPGLGGGGGGGGGFGDGDGPDRKKKDRRPGSRERLNRMRGRAAGKTVGAIKAGGFAGLMQKGKAGLGMAVDAASNSKYMPSMSTLKMVGKGGAGILGGMLLNGVEDKVNSSEAFAGKGASQVGLGAANGALTGATIGSIIPGLGTGVGAAVGGAIGGIYAGIENWDNVKKDFISAGTSLSASITSGLGIASSMGNSMMNTMRDSGAMAGDTVKGFLEFGTSTASGVMNSITSNLTSMSSSFLGTKDEASKTISSAWDSIKGATTGVDMPLLGKFNPTSPIIDAFKSMTTDNVAAPTTPSMGSIAGLDKQVANSQVKALTDRIASMERENSELRSQFNIIAEALADGNATQRAGLTELINETKRSARGINTLNSKL